MQEVTLKDKTFRVSIPSANIQAAIERLAAQLNTDLKGKQPLFIGVLNGSFMFLADLFRRMEMDCEVSFVKVASYHGTESTGQVKELVGLSEDVKGRTIILVEDIVDTGVTIDYLYRDLQSRGPAEIKVATLLLKPDAYANQVPVDYVALEIPNDFIVGYGLDYDGLGRNLEDIYTVVAN